MEGISINLFGIYGLCAIILIAGAWIFETSPDAGGWTIFFGVVIALGITISDISAKHRRLNILKFRTEYGG